MRAQGQPVIHPWPGVSRAFLEPCASQEPSYSLLTADCVSTMCSPAFWEQETYWPKQFPFSKSHPFYLYTSPSSKLRNKRGTSFHTGTLHKAEGRQPRSQPRHTARALLQSTQRCSSSLHSVPWATPLNQGCERAAGGRWQALSRTRF